MVAACTPYVVYILVGIAFLFGIGIGVLCGSYMVVEGGRGGR